MCMFRHMSETSPKKTERLQLVISPEEIVQIDRWRREQPVLLSRSAAIRHLIQIALEPPRNAKARPQ